MWCAEGSSSDWCRDDRRWIEFALAPSLWELVLSVVMLPGTLANVACGQVPCWLLWCVFECLWDAEEVSERVASLARRLLGFWLLLWSRDLIDLLRRLNFLDLLDLLRFVGDPLLAL